MLTKPGSLAEDHEGERFMFHNKALSKNRFVYLV